MKMFRLVSAWAVALLVALFLSGGTASAAACKGLSKSACGKNPSCSWVNSYRTKKGVTVEGYCRNKPGKASKSAADKARSTGKKAGATPDKGKKTRKAERKGSKPGKVDKAKKTKAKKTKAKKEKAKKEKAGADKKKKKKKEK